MPSRKQRRRRAKDRRHEYEYVYVDDSGHEIEPSPEEDRKREPTRAKGAASGKKIAGVREAKPPSWQRSLRRSALFFPLFFIVFSLVNKGSAVEIRVLS